MQRNFFCRAVDGAHFVSNIQKHSTSVAQNCNCGVAAPSMDMDEGAERSKGVQAQEKASGAQGSCEEASAEEP